jgi:hypothetical protein
MSITIGSWVIPALITAVLLCIMLRPYRSSGHYDFGALFRVLWLIPISVVWMVYMGVLLLIK